MPNRLANSAEPGHPSGYSRDRWRIPSAGATAMVNTATPAANFGLAGCLIPPCRIGSRVVAYWDSLCEGLKPGQWLLF